MTTVPESFEFPLPPALTLALVVAEFLKHFASNFGFELRSGSSVFVNCFGATRWRQCALEKFEDLELFDQAFFHIGSSGSLWKVGAVAGAPALQSMPVSVRPSLPKSDRVASH